MTTGYQDRLEVERLTLENWADILACGVDPEKSACFVQSDIKAHAELWLEGLDLGGASVCVLGPITIIPGSSTSMSLMRNGPYSMPASVRVTDWRPRNSPKTMTSMGVFIEK